MHYKILSILLLLPALSLAQLSSPTAGTTRYSLYPSAPLVRDPVFIYCRVTGLEKGSITARSPGGSAPFTFSWYRWSDITKSFSSFIRTDSPVTESTIGSLDEGGYQVRISDGSGFTAALVGWIHLDKPVADAKLQNFTCDYVALNGTAAIDTFQYRDPSSGAPIRLRNAISFMWSSDPSSPIPYPDLEIDPITFSPPLEDVVYKLQVVDSFQCRNESSFPYKSIHVKADFTVDPDNGEAPLEVSFTDKSVRGFKYMWEFGDDSVSLLKDPPPHTYYRPGEYSVKLTIESEQLCVDSMRFDKIMVDPSKLDIPNVFTPDGDGINDFFMVESASLRKIIVEIYSRSGVKVYGFTGEGQALAEWRGWDGNVNRTSSKAAPGVYFYVIRALGWDDKVYDGVEYRGFIHLYR